MNIKIIKYLLISTVLTFASLGCGSGGIGGGSGSDDIQYAALGASDATGVGASSFTNGYVYLIEDGIVGSGLSTNLLNYGIPGAKIDEIRDIELDLLELGNDPDVVTIFVGVNDIVDGTVGSNFESDLNGILDHLSQINGVKVFIANIPDITQLPRFKNDPDPNVTIQKVQEFNEIINRQAAMFNATVVDLSTQIPDDNLISSDDFHPNDEGYRQMADLFLQEILPQIL